MSFHDQDTVGIFSTETLQVEVAARDLVDSFSIGSSNNRFFVDSTVRARPAQVIAAVAYSFYLSFVDTGWHKIVINTFRKTGEKASVEYSLFCKSPLLQTAITGNYDDSIVLNTTPVADADVLYHWDFGGGQIFEKTKPIDKVLIASFLSAATGYVWVSDISEKNNSPKTQFSFFLKDTTGPVIVSVNANVKNDIIQTGDSTFTFLSRIITLRNTAVVSATINGQGFNLHDTDQEVYGKVFSGVVAYAPPAAPLTALVRAQDIFGTISQKVFYIVFNPALGRSSETVLSVKNPVLDSTSSAVSAIQPELIYGGVANYSSQPYDVFVRLRVNGAVLPNADTVRQPFAEGWNFTAPLMVGPNQLTVTAYRLSGDSCAAKNFSIFYNPALAKSDSAPPVILDISAGGTHNFFTANNSMALRIIAVGVGSGIELLTVNGTVLQSSAEAKGYIWYDTVPVFHSQTEANWVKIIAIDTGGHITDTSINIYKNRLPIIATALSPPNPIIAGSVYRDSIVALDPDGDAVTVKKTAGPSALAVSTAGYIQWSPEASDTGLQILSFSLSDGYQFITYSCSLFVALPIITAGPPVKFITTAQDFPAYLEVGKDSLTAVLQTINGTPPLQLSAYVKPSNSALTPENNVLQWKPTLADTGLATLVITVTDLMKKSDTLLPTILVVAPNRPFTIGVSPPIPDGTLDLSASIAPDTLHFTIHDPDNPLLERHTVEIFRSHTETVNALDTSQSFTIILDPQRVAASVLKDTLAMIITDKAGHADTLTYSIVYHTAPLAKKIVINTTSGNGGAGVFGAVLKFPALVRLDKTNFDFTVVNSAGFPLGFQKQNGAAAPFAIEQGDSINGQAVMWVIVDTVYGNDSSHYLTMSWDPSLASPQNAAAVFDTGNGFVGVWHMNENPMAGANSIKDRTLNKFHASPNGSTNAITTVNGAIGTALNFNGTNGYCNAGNVNLTGRYSVSLWVMPAALNGYQRFICKDTGYTIWYDKDLIGARMEHNSGAAWRGIPEDGGVVQPMNTGAWYYLTGTYDLNVIRLYVNGALATSSNAINVSPKVKNTGLLFGKTVFNSTSFVTGMMDEIRVEKSTRSGDWIRLCYQNQKPGSTVVTVK
jgi:hypothetical protein